MLRGVFFIYKTLQIVFLAILLVASSAIAPSAQNQLLQIRNNSAARVPSILVIMKLQVIVGLYQLKPSATVCRRRPSRCLKIRFDVFRALVGFEIAQTTGAVAPLSWDQVAAVLLMLRFT